jgi:hypothetical protein
MQIRIDFWVGSGFYVIRCHFLLVLIEISQLLFHIFIFYSFFFLRNIILFLVLDIFCSELLVFEESFVLFNRLIKLRLSIFGFHFDNFWHCIEGGSASPELGLALYPLKDVKYTLFFVKVNLLDHTGSFLHFEEFEVVNYILDVEPLLFFKQYNQWYIFKLSFRVQNVH